MAIYFFSFFNILNKFINLFWSQNWSYDVHANSTFFFFQENEKHHSTVFKNVKSLQLPGNFIFFNVIYYFSFKSFVLSLKTFYDSNTWLTFLGRVKQENNKVFYRFTAGKVFIINPQKNPSTSNCPHFDTNLLSPSRIPRITSTSNLCVQSIGILPCPPADTPRSH